MVRLRDWALCFGTRLVAVWLVPFHDSSLCHIPAQEHLVAAMGSNALLLSNPLLLIWAAPKCCVYKICFFRKLCLTLRKAREYLQNVPTRGLMIIFWVLFAPNGCSEGLGDLTGRTAGNV